MLARTESPNQPGAKLAGRTLNREGTGMDRDACSRAGHAMISRIVRFHNAGQEAMGTLDPGRWVLHSSILCNAPMQSMSYVWPVMKV